MINTVSFRAQQKIVRDGRTIIVAVPPPLALQNQGPQIMVSVTQPKAVIEKMPSTNGGPQQIKTIQCKALIDTGAFSCVISPRIAEELKLVQTGFKKVNSVQDEQERPAYFAAVHFHWGKSAEVAVVSCPLKGFDFIVGRDILMNWHFTYNGKDGFIIICD